MSIWDEVKIATVGVEVLVPRNDGTGLFVSGVVLEKDEAAKKLVIGNIRGRHELDYSADNPALFPPSEAVVTPPEPQAVAEVVAFGQATPAEPAKEEG